MPQVLIKPLHGETCGLVKSRPLVNALVINARQDLIGADSPGFLRQFEDFFAILIVAHEGHVLDGVICLIGNGLKAESEGEEESKNAQHPWRTSPPALPYSLTGPSPDTQFSDRTKELRSFDWQWIWGGKSWFTILPASSILQAIVLLSGFGIVLVME